MTTIDEPGRTVRMGLAGYGFGGRYFHAPLLAGSALIDFTGVVTSAPARRRQVADEHGVACFDSLADLAAAGAEAVAISTPADTHAELSIEALGLGLHVLCDKPFALSSASAVAVADAATAAGRLVVPFQNRRWDSDLLTLKSVLAQGTVGEVQRFESRFERFDSAAGLPAAGGGILFDFGSHLVDQALHVFGPVESVYAETGPLGHEAGRELRFFAALRHVDGVVSHLYGDWVQGAPEARFRLTGTEGTFVVGPGMDGQEQVLISGGSPGSAGERWGTEPESAWGWLQRGEDLTPVPSQRGRWDLLYDGFARSVRDGTLPPVLATEAIASLTVIEACGHSARTGHSVVL